ncbi:hypothetical protein KP509_20G049400 [Ceratopteris richardii]|uniref:TraB domain-containing protein n=1 Tax=Ceratopteris richardii TaxID=49495 RepID=A0A8T2SIQ2_CERRI|nr:hypothetical protein KP509_20G049400 [Ceratopteris richardii]
MMELLNNNPSQSSSLHVSSSHLIENDSAVQEDSAMTHRFSSPSEGNLSSEASSNTSGQPENEGLAEEDSHYQEQELPDDTKKEMFKEICKGSFILSRHSEALGIDSSVYLIGTAHVSEESCREVKAAIRLIKPQVVFLELCHKRTSVLQTTPFVVPTLSDMISTWKQRKSNMLGIVYGWFLAKVADKLDISPGSEFRAAYEEALDCGAKVVLGDRDIQVTLRRTWGKMSMWHKTKFILVLIYQSLFLPQAEQLNELIEKLKDADILTVAFEELSKFSPTLLETLINERDMFMSAALQKVAEQHSSVVAVVGRGHISGIAKYWGQDIDDVFKSQKMGVVSLSFMMLFSQWMVLFKHSLKHRWQCVFILLGMSFQGMCYSMLYEWLPWPLMDGML